MAARVRFQAALDALCTRLRCVLASLLQCDQAFGYDL
jgi:hypothetical protein